MIVEVAQEAVANADDVQKRDRRAEEGGPQDRRCCWSPSPDGELRFVALSAAVSGSIGVTTAAEDRGCAVSLSLTRRCRSAQSSTWLTMPSASFGSNQVDFGGMMPPASATAIRSAICVG